MAERTSRATWAKRVERWKESGLTAKEFASELGIRASTLSYWKWFLGKETRERGGRGRSAAVVSRTTSLPFVELAPMAVGSELELVLGRYTVRLPASFDDETLRRLLDVLESRS